MTYLKTGICCGKGDPMIYAIRSIGGGRQTLVEYASKKWLGLAAEFGFTVRQVDSATARKWVKDGKEHETGLFIEDGKVRWCEPGDREG
jgi:hypothetical protein